MDDQTMDDIDTDAIELEHWEQEDQRLRDEAGLDEEERRHLWRSLRSPEQVEMEDLLEKIMEERSCDAEEAYRILNELAGVTI